MFYNCKKLRKTRRNDLIGSGSDQLDLFRADILALCQSKLKMNSANSILIHSIIFHTICINIVSTSMTWNLWEIQVRKVATDVFNAHITQPTSLRFKYRIIVDRIKINVRFHFSKSSVKFKFLVMKYIRNIISIM